MKIQLNSPIIKITNTVSLHLNSFTFDLKFSKFKKMRNVIVTTKYVYIIRCCVLLKILQVKWFILLVFECAHWKKWGFKNKYKCSDNSFFLNSSTSTYQFNNFLEIHFGSITYIIYSSMHTKCILRLTFTCSNI